MMFTGEVPGKKRVNLAGKSGVFTGKQALIEQSRREREERELVRRKIDAAITISRHVRGHLTRRKIKYSLIELLTQCISRGEDFRHLLVMMHVVAVPPYPSVENLKAMISRIGTWCESPTDYLRISCFIREVARTCASALIAQIADLIDTLLSSSFSDSVPFLPRKIHELIHLLRNLSDDVKLRVVMRVIESGQSVLAINTFLVYLQEISDLQSVPVMAYPSVPSEYAIPSELDLLKITTNMIRLIFDGQDFTASVRVIAESVPDPNRIVIDNLIVSGLLSKSARIGLLEILRLETLSDETQYRLSTQTSLVEELGKSLIFSFENRPADSQIPWLVSRFTRLYSRVVAGISSGYTSVLSTENLERLFPLLNKYAYESVIRFSMIDESVFHLIRAVYDKKHIYPNLGRDELWTIPDSVTYIPNTVYAYDLTVNSEEEIESFHLGEAHQEISSVSRSVFDILIESLPHVIPLQRRLRIFAAALAEDQLKHTRQAWAMRLPWEGSGRVRKVRRSHLISDGLGVISSASRDVLRIEFVGTDGTVEAGIDGGGLFKEFMQQWTIGIMDPQFGLFHQLSSGRLVPALDAYRTHADADRLFRAAGRAVGKALYEMVLLETHLGEAFLSRVLSRPFSLDQLQEIDEGLFRNLKFVNETENVEELGLAFSVSTGGIGDMDFDLIPNGSTVPVTSSNKLRYVLLASWYYLSRQLDRPAAAFAAGLSELLPLSRLKIFSPSEINLVISGEQRKGFSVDELRANVVYGGGYSEYSSTVKLLWEVLREDFTDKDRSAFLSFVTSAPRPPLLGFRVMHPKFGINRVPDRDRLPTSSTCANLLKLPDYQDRGVLREKILAAIYSQSGFDLS